MGTQNLNNYYFNRLDTKINYSSYYDLFLASDEKDYNQEVMWSNNIIGYNDGDRLPVWIDLTASTCSTQPVTNCGYQFVPYTAPTFSDYYTNNNYRPFVILSKNNWSKAKSSCECPYSGQTPFKICDAIFTGLDNGLYNVNQFKNKQCIDLYNTLPGALTFDPFSYDKRFKMHQVKGFGYPQVAPNAYVWYTDTSILNNSDASGYYQDLRGGFYQGFYKLYGYPYEVLPTRPNKGWSFETYLKLNTISDSISQLCTTSATTTIPPCCTPPVGDQTIACGYYGNCYNTSGWNYYQSTTTATTINFGSATTVCSPLASGTDEPNNLLNYSQGMQYGIALGDTGNGGFFFYKGIRAEDKYQNRGGQSADTQLDHLSACTTLTGVTGCCNTEETEVKLTNQNKSPNPEYDVYSNAFGVRLTDDMRLGYRTLRYTGTCKTTGSTEIYNHSTHEYESEDCNTGMTFDCGYVIEESYSDPICQFITHSGNCAQTWIQVDVVFDRNLYLEDCEIYNNGGVNDLVKIRLDKFERYGSHVASNGGAFGCHPVTPTPEKEPCKDQYPRFIEDAYFDFNCHGAQVQSWFNEREYRLGTLTFYVNGRRVHKVENYEEIIPRQLNTNKQTQVGVAYNMSWGGGTFGLRESLLQQNLPLSADQCTITSTTTTTKLDLTTDRRLLSDNFGGSFVGGISQMMYYEVPLTPDEIYHNFLINKNRYSLVDCEECKNCNNGCVDCGLATAPITEGPPDTNPPTGGCPPQTTSPPPGSCAGMIFGGTATTTEQLEYFINPANGNQSVSFGDVYFELERGNATPSCAGCNGFNGGLFILYQITSYSATYNGVTNTWNTIGTTYDWITAGIWLIGQGAPVGASMTYAQVQAIPGVTINIQSQAPCSGCQ
tara:strand:- start:662 stop:3319 length:2658 start_codon:yes stop_codon:yes gene_type:complete